MFPPAELAGNLAALCRWSRTYEIPDVLDFCDFVHCKDEVADSLSTSQAAPNWGPAWHLPYPNGDKLRDMIVLGACDLALLRVSAGRIAETAEPQLSDRAFGFRTERTRGVWHFRDIGSTGWRRFIESAIQLLQRGDLNAMCATDIASYYGSVDFDRLEPYLLAGGCDPHAVHVSLSALRKWASEDGVTGLPIGPEASGVLGNAFLIPVDQMLTSSRAEYVRWMDDYKIMGPDEMTCRSVLDAFDECLWLHGLMRSESKTDYYPNSFLAKTALRDAKLDSLGSWLNSGIGEATERLREAFETDVAGARRASRSQFRFLVKNLQMRHDDCVALALAADPDLASIDPKVSGDYLATVALDTPAVVTAMCEQLRAEPANETHALMLHFLRALARKRGGWGTTEGELFGSIAEGSCPAPVRCWAVHAFSRTPRWRQGHMMESTEAETDPLVRRIKISTLRKIRPSPRRTEFLRHMCGRFPELIYTARWLETEAA